VEAQPIYPTDRNDMLNDLFKNCRQNCICLSCDNDVLGYCSPSKEDCVDAQVAGRCPIKSCASYRPRGEAIRAEIEFLRITCPECGGQSHIKIFEAGRCPHCGVHLGGLTDVDLQAEPKNVTVSIDRLTGRVAVVQD